MMLGNLVRGGDRKRNSKVWIRCKGNSGETKKKTISSYFAFYFALELQ